MFILVSAPVQINTSILPPFLISSLLHSSYFLRFLSFLLFSSPSWRFFFYTSSILDSSLSHFTSSTSSFPHHLHSFLYFLLSSSPCFLSYPPCTSFFMRHVSYGDRTCERYSTAPMFNWIERVELMKLEWLAAEWKWSVPVGGVELCRGVFDFWASTWGTGGDLIDLFI